MDEEDVEENKDDAAQRQWKLTLWPKQLHVTTVEPDLRTSGAFPFRPPKGILAADPNGRPADRTNGFSSWRFTFQVIPVTKT